MMALLDDVGMDTLMMALLGGVGMDTLMMALLGLGYLNDGITG